MKNIWIVYEDNHGDVSYWKTKKKAYKEARDIIMQDPYHPYDSHKIIREDITDKEIEEYEYGVGVKKEPLEKSWA
ncbi:MAG: hypothetical protein EOM53_05575 [Alphaproteobacteria bacterium]|nr:hypothetical protein [Alphaproteobacteria bacterium]